MAIRASIRGQPNQHQENKLKPQDHVLREVVNSLRDIAIEFHGADQLRERLRAALEPLLDQSEQSAPLSAAALTVDKEYLTAQTGAQTIKENLIVPFAEAMSALNHVRTVASMSYGRDPRDVLCAFINLAAAPAAQGDVKDAERLRWMAESGARVSWSMDGEYCNVWLPAERDGTESLPAEGYPQKCYDSWHRAIDAAIAAKAAS